jgi:lipid-binding SYLF domain-containing protein
LNYNSPRFSHLVLRLFLVLAVFTSTQAVADNAEKIQQRAAEALETFAIESPTGTELLGKAAGVLVFPDIVKMGFGVGGEYGEGVLLIDEKPVAYYSTAAGSIGFQAGVQFKAYVIAFMTDAALEKFQASKGWQVGVDGSVALIKLGAGGKLDTETARQPIVGFVFSNRGLMYNLTLEGSKITKLVR